jgi:cell wall-associated NlpC family hydrolase
VANWWDTLFDFMVKSQVQQDLHRMGGTPNMDTFTASVPLGSGYDKQADDELKRKRICDFAKLQLGKPYHLGIEVPFSDDNAGEWDCSELTENAYRRNGLTLPDGSNFQYDFCRPIEGFPKAADLGFVWSTAWNRIGHVIMALGDGTAIEARGKPVSKVQIIPVHEWESHPRWRGWRKHPELA